jgi:sulfur relay (sulfurtransferase) DsrF/TusC family protein
MNEAREAPTNEPTIGKLADAPLAGDGAGAATSSAITALAEAAAKRIAHAIFFISIAVFQAVKRQNNLAITIEKTLPNLV